MSCWNASSFMLLLGGLVARERWERWILRKGSKLYPYILTHSTIYDSFQTSRPSISLVYTTQLAPSPPITKVRTSLKKCLTLSHSTSLSSILLPLPTIPIPTPIPQTHSHHASRPIPPPSRPTSPPHPRSHLLNPSHSPSLSQSHPLIIIHQRYIPPPKPYNSRTTLHLILNIPPRPPGLGESNASFLVYDGYEANQVEKYERENGEQVDGVE